MEEEKVKKIVYVPLYTNGTPTNIIYNELKDISLKDKDKIAIYELKEIKLIKLSLE